MRIGLLADTHVPYRAPFIPPSVVAALSGVELILHAGDVDEPWALEPLRALAPVHAVRGNYHIFDGSAAGASLPESVELELEGFRVALCHGHHPGLAGWFWKARTLARNLLGRWDFEAYEAAIVARLGERFPAADIIIFGHTHRFYFSRHGELLIVNPGAALPTACFDAPYPPSVAHLLLERGREPALTQVILDELAPGGA